MSGIYLAVWPETKDQHLQATKSGWPHVTVAYTGKLLKKEELVALSASCFTKIALAKCTLDKAKVNSFTVEKTGEVRHDVLLMLAAEDAKQIIQLREQVLKQNFPDKYKDFSMQEPHVTLKICTKLEDAQKLVEDFNKNKVSLKVTYTGVTID